MERVEITQIKGISAIRRLPRLGKIRLGVMVLHSKTGKTYPEEIPYFLCPDEVKKVYGEEPTELDIMFPTENSTAFFPQAYKWYGETGLKCKGNGEVALRRVEDCSEEQVKQLNGNTEGLVEIDCPCELLGKECTVCGNLMVILPKVSIGGVYQIDTGSYHNIVNINSYIDYLREITKTPQRLQGRVSLIPLKIRRIKQTIQYKDDDGRVRKSNHYLLQLELKLALSELDTIRRDAINIPQVEYLVEQPVEDGQVEAIKVIDEEEDKSPSTALEKKKEERETIEKKIEKETVEEKLGKEKEIMKEKVEQETAREKLGQLLLKYCSNDKEKAKELLKSLTVSDGNREGLNSLYELSETKSEEVYRKFLKKISDEKQPLSKERIDLLNQILELKTKMKLSSEDMEKILLTLGCYPKLERNSEEDLERIIDYLRFRKEITEEQNAKN